MFSTSPTQRVEGVENFCRPPLSIPARFKPFPDLDAPLPGYGAEFDVKHLKDVLPPLLEPLQGEYETKFVAPNAPWDEKSAFPYRGGETVALERLELYFHKGSPPPVAKYKVRRHAVLFRFLCVYAWLTWKGVT